MPVAGRFLPFAFCVWMLIPAVGSAFESQRGLLARDRAAALAQTAEELLRAGRTDESLPYLRKLLELQPYNDNARYALGLALLFPPEPKDSSSGGLTRKRLVESARLLGECVERARGVSETGSFIGGRLFYLGLAHWWLGQPDQALGLFEQSFQADPDRVEALYNRFAIYEELGRPTEASIELERFERFSRPPVPANN